MVAACPAARVVRTRQRRGRRAGGGAGDYGCGKPGLAQQTAATMQREAGQGAGRRRGPQWALPPSRARPTRCSNFAGRGAVKTRPAPGPDPGQPPSRTQTGKAPGPGSPSGRSAHSPVPGPAAGAGAALGAPWSRRAAAARRSRPAPHRTQRRQRRRLRPGHGRGHAPSGPGAWPEREGGSAPAPPIKARSPGRFTRIGEHFGQWGSDRSAERLRRGAGDCGGGGSHARPPAPGSRPGFGQRAFQRGQVGVFGANYRGGPVSPVLTMHPLQCL